MFVWLNEIENYKKYSIVEKKTPKINRLDTKMFAKYGIYGMAIAIYAMSINCECVNVLKPMT